MAHTIGSVSWRILIAAFSFVGASGGLALGQTVLPVEYDEDRFIVTPQSPSGVQLRFLTDTGGGTFVLDTAVMKADLKTIVTPPRSAQGQDRVEVDFTAFAPGKSIPPPISSPAVRVLPSSDEDTPSALRGIDGLLGQAWFAGRVWTFDYPKKQLVVYENESPKPPAGESVKLGFQTDDKGERKSNFPRVQIVVDGKTLDMLFDTGASTALTDEAYRTLGSKGDKVRAASFITTSIFDEWRRSHPEWKVVEKGEEKSDEAMIEVPKVRIAGKEVGPVWFTRRPDRNFHEYMTQWMDKRVEGAVGGNILRNFSITVDYPKGMAYFVGP